MQAQQLRRAVVVGVDGSESALAAVRWAAAEAGRRRLPLRLVHALCWPETRHLGDPGFHDQEVLVRVAHEQVFAAIDVAAATAPGVEIQQLIEAGDPVSVLEAESRRTQLLVLGHRGLGGVTGLLLGSVTVALAAHAACPVVVVRGADLVEASAALPVVVGVDSTTNSEAAIAFAFDVADARRVPLVAVHMHTLREVLVDPVLDLVTDWDATVANEHKILGPRLADYAKKYPDVPVRCIIARDRPAYRLLEQAQHAQLVIVGSRGRGAFSGLVLGSVSHALLHHAPCPVAVVRPQPGTDPGDLGGDLSRVHPTEFEAHLRGAGSAGMPPPRGVRPGFRGPASKSGMLTSQVGGLSNQDPGVIDGPACSAQRHPPEQAAP